MKSFWIAAALVFGALGANAGESCQATNDNQDARCSIECEPGKAAVCADATGSSTPSCECRGSSTDYLKKLLSNDPSAGKESPTLAATTPAHRVEQTNVLEVINQRLAQLPDFQLQTSCKQVEIDRVCEVQGSCARFVPLVLQPMHALCREVCRPVYREQCTPVMGKLTATYPLTLLTPVQATVSAPNWNEIPNQVLGYRQSYINCSEEKQSITFRHTEVTKEGFRITKSKVLKTGETNVLNINAKASFKIADIGGEVGGGGSRTITHDITVTDAKEQSDEETRTLDVSIPLIVPAMSLVTMDHSWVRREAPLPFVGSAEFDAPLSANQAQKTMISQVLPAAVDRSFSFAGTISAAFTAKGDAVVRQEKLSAAQCSGEKGLRVKSSQYK